ncbi:MAG: NAD(+)/NADH kinase [Deltaproteobacteria bacterium]|nr:NAD(+)/NADH kinase [Deltaproteobacteria bacterium]MBW2420597.1 NAD(+)/NADH kinase [Deltaproteobacteria bacterium]
MSQPSQAPKTIGVVSNPMSGKDIRRLAARASTTTREIKRDQITRAVIGAAAAGAERVLVFEDPYLISDSAVEHLGVAMEVEVLHAEVRGEERDTVLATERLREAGCAALLVLGGDGTNRIVAKTWPDAVLMPLSTGTNNVFPSVAEATAAGAALGLVASGRLPLEDAARRSKVVHLSIEGEEPDLALIDAVLLVDDFVGNRLHLDPSRMRHIVLSRAEPTAVGPSSIGGLVRPTSPDEDLGVEVELSGPGGGGRPLLAPVSAGLYGQAFVSNARRLELGEAVELSGPGILALDGDRARKLADGQDAHAHVARDGPWVIDIDVALRRAADRALFFDREAWHDSLNGFWTR